MSVTAQFKGAAPLKKPSFQLGATQRFSFRLALFACASLNCCVIRFVFSLKKPPPCHLPAAATPHARRAHPTAKNFVFASGPPSYRPGEVRGATSLELRPVISFPSLAQTHMFFLASASFDCFLVIPRSPSPLSAPIFFVSAQFNVYGIIEWRSISIATAVSQREPSADATLMLLQQNTMRLFFGSVFY